MYMCRAAFPALLACLTCLAGGVTDTARAALSELGGTGILELQSAESKRPARLELGTSGSYQQLRLGDSANTRLNVLRAALNTAFGLPGGFEISGTVPALFHYTSLSVTASPLDEELDVKLGDVSGRLRWTGPLAAPGLRWGFEGEALFATGSGNEETYPGRGTVKPYTTGKNSYSARSMLTWDGLRAGSGVPLRLHANAAYTMQQDEGRFLIPRAPLPLELGAPARTRDNDFLSLGAAIEVDLPRLTLFGEVVTDQFVNERTLLKGKENRIAVTPGLRLWFPGGVTLMGAYSMNLSEDDQATAFDPGRAFADDEWRVALSFGTVYRGARARAVVAAPAPVLESVVAVAPALTAPVGPATPDSATLAKLRREREIVERRDVQDEPRTPKLAAGVEAPALEVPSTPRSPGGQGVRLLDSDHDGIPDSQDQCPLLAEDFDGFQDLDGCPDLDNDQDGIMDIRDQCPNDPETFNGFYDLDGCPDETPIRWIGPPPPGRLMAPGPMAPPDTAVSARIPADTSVVVRRPVATLPSAAPVVAPAPVKIAVTPAAARPDTSPAQAVPPRVVAPVAVAPVAVAPVAVAPTAVAPVAVAPTAVAPVAVAPSAVVPVAVAPTAVAPSAVAPTAVAPSAVAPVAVAPVAVAPVAVAPSAVVPSAVVPSAVVPSAVAPVAVAPSAVVPSAVAPSAVVPVAVAPAAWSPADSLRLALQFERAQRRSLQERLAQSEAERRDLATRAVAMPRLEAVPESIGPAPVVKSSASRNELRTGLDEAVRQNAELRARVRDLELRQDRVLQGQTPHIAPVNVPAGPTLVTTPAAGANADVAARLAALEKELSDLRGSSGLREARTATTDSAGRAAAARLVDIEARLTELRTTAAAVAPPPTKTAQALDVLLPTGVARVFPEIEFRSGSAQVVPDAAGVIVSIADALREVPEARLRVVGYTDNVGDAARNLALSRARAQAVANTLIEEGVDRDRLTVEGRGEEAPVASNRVEAGRRLNRRVEFVRIR